MATVTVHTELAAPAGVVFDAVSTVDAFELVTAGLLRYSPTRARTGPIAEGEELRGWLLLGGVVPISRHRLRVERVDPVERVVQSDEGGGLVRRWRHRIQVTPVGTDRCRYVDEIEIDAGALTPAVRAFAAVFYRARQRRWRRLAPLLAAARQTSPGAATGPAAWLRRHEQAFNTGDWGPVMDDYLDDAVLEAHVDGRVVELRGRSEIRSAVELASAAGVETTVRRVVGCGDVIAAQIDAEGRPFMVSFWELCDGRIARDVSIVLPGPTG